MFIDPVTSLEEFFIDIHIPFDCEFLVAEKSNAAGEGVMSLTEIYRVQPTQLLQTYRLGNWSSATGLTWSTVPFNQRRGDLQGVTIKAAVRADVRKTTNTLAKFLILGNVTLITTFKTGSIDVDKIVLQVKVFWVMTSFRVVVGYQRFGSQYCLCLQGEVNMEAAWTSETMVSYHNTALKTLTKISTVLKTSNFSPLYFFSKFPVQYEAQYYQRSHAQ
jgi:hypothetical protein